MQSPISRLAIPRLSLPRTNALCPGHSSLSQLPRGIFRPLLCLALALLFLAPTLPLTPLVQAAMPATVELHTAADLEKMASTQPILVVFDEEDYALAQAIQSLVPQLPVYGCTDPVHLNLLESNLLSVMPENQSFPLLETRLGVSFQPLVRATIVLATNTPALLPQLQTWSAFQRWLAEGAQGPDHQPATVSLEAPTSYFMHVLDQLGPEKRKILKGLHTLNKEGRFFSTGDAKMVKTSAKLPPEARINSHHTSQRPPVQEEGAYLPAQVYIAFDYQIAKANLALDASVEAAATAASAANQVPQESVNTAPPLARSAAQPAATPSTALAAATPSAAPSQAPPSKQSLPSTPVNPTNADSAPTNSASAIPSDESGPLPRLSDRKTTGNLGYPDPSPTTPTAPSPSLPPVDQEPALPPDWQIDPATGQSFNASPGWISLVIPSDGTLLVDFGLLAGGRYASLLLTQSFSPDRHPVLLSSLLAHGYRTPENSANPLLYPNEETYSPASRIKNYLEFNEQIFPYEDQFQRHVGLPPFFAPTGLYSKLISYIMISLLTILLLFSIYYRLDKAPYKTYLTILSILVSIWVLLGFVRLLFSSIGQAVIFSHLLFLPLPLIAIAWHRLACSYAKELTLPVTSSWDRFYLTALGFAVMPLVALPASFTPWLILTFSLYALFCFYRGLVILTEISERDAETKAIPLWETRIDTVFLALFILALGALAFWTWSWWTNPWFSNTSLILAAGLWLVVFLLLVLSYRYLPANSKYFEAYKYNPDNLRILDHSFRDVLKPEFANDIPYETTLYLKQAVDRHTASIPAPSPKASPKFLSFWTDFPLPRSLTSPPTNTLADFTIKMPDPQNPDHVLGLRDIQGGFIFWEEDIAEINQLKRDLQRVNQKLQNQAQILGVESKVQSKLAASTIRHRLLSEVEDSISQTITEVKAALKNLADGVASGKIDQEGTPSQPSELKLELSRIKSMISQCKRKSNLMIRGQADVRAEEVKMIFREALADVGTAGIRGLCIIKTGPQVALARLLVYYDYFQDILQKSTQFGRVSLLLTINDEENAPPESSPAPILAADPPSNATGRAAATLDSAATLDAGSDQAGEASPPKQTFLSVFRLIWNGKKSPDPSLDLPSLFAPQADLSKRMADLSLTWDVHLEPEGSDLIIELCQNLPASFDPVSSPSTNTPAPQVDQVPAQPSTPSSPLSTLPLSTSPGSPTSQEGGPHHA